MTELQWLRTADGLPTEDCKSEVWWVSNRVNFLPSANATFEDLKNYNFYCPRPLIAPPPPKEDSKLVKQITVERDLWYMIDAGKMTNYEIKDQTVGMLNRILARAKNGDFDE